MGAISATVSEEKNSTKTPVNVNALKTALMAKSKTKNVTVDVKTNALITKPNKMTALAYVLILAPNLKLFKTLIPVNVHALIAVPPLKLNKILILVNVLALIPVMLL